MNVLLLDYEIKRKGYTKESLAEAIGISRTAFYRKCSGKSDFTLGEIKAIAKELDLHNVDDIFFAEEVS